MLQGPGQSRFKWIQLGGSTALLQETRSRVAFSGERGQNFYLPAISAHFRPLPLIFSHCGHFRPLPPIFAIWCPDRLAVSGDLKIGTAFNTAFRLEIRHEAWQEPSVIKTRLPWLQGAGSLRGVKRALYDRPRVWTRMTAAPPSRRAVMFESPGTSLDPASGAILQDQAPAGTFITEVIACTSRRAMWLRA